MITKDNPDFFELLQYIDEETFPYKIGFDSCTVPALTGLKNTVPESLDSCEAARWSAYISADMKMLPCSFCREDEGYTVDLRTHSIEQAWHSEQFERIRAIMRGSCPECRYRGFCLGGCPLMKEIVICKERMK